MVDGTEIARFRSHTELRFPPPARDCSRSIQLCGRPDGCRSSAWMLRRRTRR
jgi:hypothetical protein